MPQLNPVFYFSQVFWLIITFSFLLIFLWRVSLPRISYVLEKREKKISDEIQKAKKLQTEAEKIQTRIDQQLSEANEKVARLINETKNNLQAKIGEKLKIVDSEIQKNIDESAIIIEKNKQDTLDTIKTQVQEITRLTLAKLTTININDKEIKDTIQTIQYKKLN